MTIELQNMTSTSQSVRIIPPATSAFSVVMGKFPGECGLVAPGMSCFYIIQFIPEYLADYDDYLLVESQAAYPLLVPLQGRRPPPILTLPHVLECGACLVGGVKFVKFECKNEGLSVGKFCIMAKDMWPPPNFRSVATLGYVKQHSFGICPAVFELNPGQSIPIEVVFMPTSAEILTVTYIIVCDNCHIHEITVTGLGELIALELLSVSGGESIPQPGELIDMTSQHLVRFEPLNPHSMAEKTLILRNKTHVELPFFWQIVKPNLQSLTLEGKINIANIKYNLDTETAFSIVPNSGTLQAHSDHPFTLCFCPQELKKYHSVLQIVLEDIPESHCVHNSGYYENGERRKENVIVLEIDCKGSTEPFQILLNPSAMIIPGENYIGVNIRRTFEIRVTDLSFLDAGGSREFEFVITGGKPGRSCHKLQCEITHSEESVALYVEADFKGPLLSIDVTSIDMGLIKLGEKVTRVLEIENLSQLPGKWKMQERLTCIAERAEEVSPFKIQPSSGELNPLGKCRVSLSFTSYTCHHLQTVLEMDVENGVGSHIPVSVEVQVPQVCLLPSHLHFELATGIPAEATVHLFNQTLLPTPFKWGELLGSQGSSCLLSVSPENGVLGPNEKKEFRVVMTYNKKDKLKDLILCCSIEDMSEPLFLAMSGEVKQLCVTYSVPFDSDEEQNLTDSENLKLRFGCEVALKSVIKRQLVITNHSELAAPFTVEVDYFSSPPRTSEDQEKHPYELLEIVFPLSRDTMLEKTRRITRSFIKKKQSAFQGGMLSRGKGAAFHVHPSEGILEAFQELTIEITAYNNMWGHYKDVLICGRFRAKVDPHGNVSERLPHLPADDWTKPSHGDPHHQITLTCPQVLYIRMDWESYNQDKDDDKLIDLLVFYGAPFPIKDSDGNEINVLWKSDTSSKKMSSTSDSTWSSARENLVIPAGGAAAIHISFTPLMLPEIIHKFECEGFALGFMSLDREVHKARFI
ncbi:hypothetical protein Chor_008405 [Crotalus horridus]